MLSVTSQQENSPINTCNLSTSSSSMSFTNQNESDQNNNCLQSNNNDSLILNEDQEHINSKTNLIVNYLPQNMTQDEIKSLFSSIGPVDSCKLIKDKLSGQSLGYAFVNFKNQEDSDKAVNALNGMRLQNKTIKVSFARPSSESIKGANLYVCGLHKDFSQSELEKMFSQFGTIISSKILTDPKTGMSKGVGFVRFDQRYEAEVAISELNGKPYENMEEPLIVKFANSPTSVKSVMGLPLAPFVPTCRGFFQPYRPSTNTSYRYSPMNIPYCPTDCSTGLTSGLSATSPAQLQTLVTAAHSHSPAQLSLPTTPIGTIPAIPIAQIPQTNSQTTTSTTATTTTTLLTTTPPNSISSTSLSSIQNYPGWSIFVYNIGPETDENLLWQLFGPFGAVQNVKIVRDQQTQKCKGFGFITMTNYEEAINAINCLNGFNLHNRILQVSFKSTTNKF